MLHVGNMAANRTTLLHLKLQKTVTVQTFCKITLVKTANYT